MIYVYLNQFLQNIVDNIDVEEVVNCIYALTQIIELYDETETRVD